MSGRDGRKAGTPGPARLMRGGPAATSMDFLGSGRRLLRLTRPQRGPLVAMLLFTIGSVASAALGPLLLGRATDLIFAGVVGRRLPEGGEAEAIEDLRERGDDGVADMLSGTDLTPGHGIDFHAVGTVLLTVLGLYLLADLLAIAQGRLATDVVQRTVARLRADVEAKLARLPLAYFDERPRGEVLSRATNDIDNIGQTLQQTLGQMVNSLLTIAGVLAMMLWISPPLAVIALATVPLSVLVAARVGRRAQPRFVEQWRATGMLNAHIEEHYTGHAVVRAFGREAEAAEEFRRHNDALFRSAFRAQFVSGIVQPLMLFVGNVNYVLVAVVGGLRVASGNLSIGDVQAFIQYSRQFTQPLNQVASMATMVQSGVASAERVFELLDAREQEPDPVRPERPAEVRGWVSLENVSFRYEPERPLIEDLSLKVAPGGTVAIVGPTGAGKTTLVNLLMRFYEVTGGTILLDGTDIAGMSRDGLRSHIGMVPQDTWLFAGTIADNIAYGREGATREQVEAAARAAHADRFVRTLPDGYDTLVEDGGTGISAGERQLITIARAFLSDPVILVLDEATSSVDTRTEVLVQRAMATLSSGRTSFVVAHRLSTIRDADVILVMEDGSIVERGTHARLLDAGGAYARLYAARFAGTGAAEID